MVNGLYTRVEVNVLTGIPLSSLYRYHKKYDIGCKLYTKEIVFTKEEIEKMKKIRFGLRRDYDHS